VNILFALLIPAGAGLFYLGLRGAGGDGAALSLALAFTAGTFLCIAMSDLLPELQFHQHDRAKLSTALVLGLLVAWGTGLLEQRAAMTAHEEGHRHLEGSDHADHHDHDGDGVPDH
jgi:zinc and cadmium transporter